MGVRIAIQGLIIVCLKCSIGLISRGPSARITAPWLHKSGAEIALAQLPLSSRGPQSSRALFPYDYFRRVLTCRVFGVVDYRGPNAKHWTNFDDPTGLAPRSDLSAMGASSDACLGGMTKKSRVDVPRIIKADNSDEFSLGSLVRKISESSFRSNG